MFNAVNNQFKQFFDFALANRRNDTAIAKIGGNVEGSTLGERMIVARTDDRIGKFRNQASRDVNNSTRTLFRQTIVDMFGGEEKIPKSVQDAMLVKDYGKGKPLTARRIIAVAKAITDLHMENAFEAPGAEPGEMARLAEEAGYLRNKDFGNLNIAANLYAKAFNVPLKEALLRAMDRSSDVHETMIAGNLYMMSAESFRLGVLAHANNAALTAANKTLVEAAVATDTPLYFAQIARNFAAKLEFLLTDPAALLDKYFKVTPQNDPLANLRQAVNTAIAEFKALATRIENGEIATEKAAVERVLGNTDFNTTFSAQVSAVVRTLRESAADSREYGYVADLLNTVANRFGAEKIDLYNKFQAAFAERELPRAIDKLQAASLSAEKNTGKALTIPYDITSGLKSYIARYCFNGVENIDRFCRKLGARGDSNLHFNDDQKARLKKLITDAFGDERAKRALPKIVDALETAFFTEFLNDSADNANSAYSRPESILANFEKHPELIKAVNVGFDTTKLDEVKSAIKAEITADLDKVLKPKANPGGANNAFIVFDDDALFPQGLREYSEGYVTFNGQNIPCGKTGRKFFGAFNDAQYGYGEFLVDKFPETHTKMRKLISFLCGMALGVGGAIESMLREGGGNVDDILAGPARNSAIMKYGTVLLDRNRLAGENYDITFDENGDVILKMTHYSQTAVMQILTDDGNPIVLAVMDTQAPVIGMAKMVTTLKITNAADAELGNAMPHFEVVDFTQEQL